jgi:hypothetical protein
MRRHQMFWQLVALLYALSSFASGQVTAKQGESAPDPNTFHGSMTIELPFPALQDTSSWRDAWAQVLDPPSMIQLRRMNCDGIHVEELWFKGKPGSSGLTNISLRIKVRNPNKILTRRGFDGRRRKSPAAP